MNPYRPRGNQNQSRPPKYACRICVHRHYFGALSELRNHLKEHGIQQLPHEQISLYELSGSSVDSLGAGVPASGGAETRSMPDYQQENRSMHDFQQNYRNRGRSSQRARGNLSSRRSQRVRNANPYVRNVSHGNNSGTDFDGRQMMDWITDAVSDGNFS